MMYRGNTQLRVRFLLMLSINQKKNIIIINKIKLIKTNHKKRKSNKHNNQQLINKIKHIQQSTINK